MQVEGSPGPEGRRGTGRTEGEATATQSAEQGEMPPSGFSNQWLHNLGLVSLCLTGSQTPWVKGQSDLLVPGSVSRKGQLKY